MEEITVQSDVSTLDCGELSAPDNGRVDTSFGQGLDDQAVYTCDTGYRLVGQKVRTCLAYGVWTTSAPTTCILWGKYMHIAL